jgi:hypothetical protein
LQGYAGDLRYAAHGGQCIRTMMALSFVSRTMGLLFSRSDGLLVTRRRRGQRANQGIEVQAALTIAIMPARIASGRSGRILRMAASEISCHILPGSKFGSRRGANLLSISFGGDNGVHFTVQEVEDGRPAGAVDP